MASLSDEVKAFIVRSLACYDTPQQVAEAVNQEFGITVPRQNVAKYDPTKTTGAGLSKKWRDLFETTREEWRRGQTEVPIANRVFRLRIIERNALRLEKAKNVPLLLQALEQAAKEVGDAYVNRHREAPNAAPAPDTAAPRSEYVLKPDEDAPPKPIL